MFHKAFRVIARQLQSDLQEPAVRGGRLVAALLVERSAPYRHSVSNARFREFCLAVEDRERVYRFANLLATSLPFNRAILSTGFRKNQKWLSPEGGVINVETS